MSNGPEMKRRKFLEGTGATTLAAVAGCLGGTGATTDTETPKQKDEDEQDNDTPTHTTEIENILQHTPYGGLLDRNNKPNATHPQVMLSTLGGEYAEAYQNILTDKKNTWSEAGIFGAPSDEHNALSLNDLSVLVTDSNIDLTTKRASLKDYGFEKEREDAGAEIWRNNALDGIWEPITDEPYAATAIIGDKKDALIDEDFVNNVVEDVSAEQMVERTLNTLGYDAGGQERAPEAEQNAVAAGLGDSYQPDVQITEYNEPLENGVQGYAFVHDPVASDEVMVHVYELKNNNGEFIGSISSQESGLGTDALTFNDEDRIEELI
jgi:hypothetical protein